MVNIIPASLPVAGGGWGASSPMGDDINQRIAEALMLQTFKPQEIKSPWQGAAEMSNAAIAGLMYRKAMDRQMDTARGMASIYGVNVPQQSAGGGPLSGLLNMFGGGSKPPAPTVAAPPPAAQQSAAPPQANLASDGLPAPVPPANIPLTATAGRQPDIADVNPSLAQAIAAGAKGLPDGYKVTVNEGYNPQGHVAGSQHHIKGMGALDVQIIDPQGNVIPNRGDDSTGMYTTLAKNAYQAAQGLGIGDKFAWGGRFGTVTGGTTPDLMHFDLGGDRGHLKPPLAQMFAQQTQPAQNAPQSSVQYATLGPPVQAKGSVFGNAPGFFDKPMYSQPNSTASGIPTTVPGIALPNRATLKQDFRVTAPNGQSVVGPQIDVGPGVAGRGVDIGAAMASKLGYGQNNFPTNSPFQVQPVVPLPPQRPQQVASNDPNFMPGAQPSFGAPMGNGIPPVGGPTDPFPTAPMAQNAPQVPLPPPRPMMSPSTPPPGQMLNGQPWNFPTMTPMPPDVRGTPVPAPTPPPANPQGVPPNMAQAPVQLAQNGPGLPQGAMPQGQSPQQAPQSDQFGRGYVFQLLQQEKARAAAQLQYAIQTRNPQLAAGAQNALMSINQQMIGMMTPQTLKSGPGDNYDIVALGPDGQYHKQTIISNQNGLLNADAQHDVGAQIASGVMPTELGLRATSGTGGLTYAQAQNAAAAERRASGAAPTGREIVGQQGERQAYVTAQKSNATKQGLLEGIANEAQNLIPMAKGASDAVPRTQYPSLNAALSAWNEHVGDPNITRLHQVVYGLANLYARAVNPQNPSDNGFRHAMDTLSAYYNKGQFDAGVNLLEQDINAMTRGGAEASQALRKQFESHQLPPAPQIPTRIPSQPTQSPQMGTSPAEAGQHFTPPRGWMWSPSRQQYKDQQGNMYDSLGNRVR